jgi:Lon protease-like protein
MSKVMDIHISHYNTLPILCIHGAVVFAGTILPIPMTMEQYEILLNETDDTDGILGIIQPSDIKKEDKTKLPIFDFGTAVEIVDMDPTYDDMVIVHLKGICRFRVLEELPKTSSMRRAVVSYKKYAETDGMTPELSNFDKKSFITLARLYMTQFNITPNWQELKNITDAELINFIAMAGPLEPSEKQAILEEINVDQQKYMLEKIMDMSLSDSFHTSTLVH